MGFACGVRAPVPWVGPRARMDVCREMSLVSCLQTNSDFRPRHTLFSSVAPLASVQTLRLESFLWAAARRLEESALLAVCDRSWTDVVTGFECLWKVYIDFSVCVLTACLVTELQDNTVLFIFILCIPLCYTMRYLTEVMFFVQRNIFLFYVNIIIITINGLLHIKLQGTSSAWFMCRGVKLGGGGGRGGGGGGLETKFGQKRERARK